MSLRVLVVETDPQRAARISGLLEKAEHEVYPLARFEEVAGVLSTQRFDAVLVPATATGDELQGVASTLQLLEKNMAAGHTPLLSCAAAGIAPEPDGSVEALLPVDFEIDAFAAAIGKLARGVSTLGSPDKSLLSKLPPDLPVFDTTDFREQMFDDSELMVEIIDLYLEESARQRQEMKAALEAGDIKEVSRVAHTIKGSLGSLHAPRARSRSQDLESAAKAGNAALGAAALGALEEELSALEPELLKLRDSVRNS